MLLAGLATDGGLYVPAEWPLLPSPDDLDAATRRTPTSAGADRRRRSSATTSPPDDLRAMCDATPTRTFRHPAVVPLVQIDHQQWLAELFHGPTLAFKDVALQLVGRLFDHVLGQRGEQVTIVGATSGDTGSAAIEAVHGCAHVDIVILYPDGGTSEVQRRQMTTVDAPNVRAVAVDGTFDDCQDLVKAMFNDAPFRERMRLSAVNSINWARVMAQIVYYVTTARSLRRPDHGVRADRQLRQRLRRLGGPADGRADRGLHRRVQRERHPHPLRQRRRHVDRHRRADAEPVDGHPGVVELRAACCSR